MLARYLASDVPSYLDPAAAELLQEGRDAFNGLGLATAQLLEVGPDVVLFPWAGDRIMNTLTIALRSAELAASAEGVAIVIEDADVDAVLDVLEGLAAGQLGTAESLAAAVLNKRSARYDWVLSEPLLTRDYARRALDLDGAVASASAILTG